MVSPPQAMKPIAIFRYLVISIAISGSQGAMTSMCDSGLAAAANNRVSLSGWLHVIWNGEPRFMLVDDQGMATRLVLDGDLMRAFGGARGLNQKRVTLEGERVDDVAETVRVLSIKLDLGGK